MTDIGLAYWREVGETADLDEKRGLVLKQTVRDGRGAVLPASAFVRYHYSAWLDHSPLPFDSTVLRNRNRPPAVRFSPDNGTPLIFLPLLLQSHTHSLSNFREHIGPRPEMPLIVGLQVALRSMRAGELSRFLLAPAVAFGQMGNPPRVPPSATVLYIVELIDFSTGASPDELLRADDVCSSYITAIRIFEFSDMDCWNGLYFKRIHTAIHFYTKIIIL